MNVAHDFVAIDFETANEKRSSPCALGIAVSKNGEIIQTNHWLIRPHKDFSWFNPFNTSIHGIDYQDVEEAPEFIEIWPDIVGFLQGQTVIAHNAPFDLSVLRHTMDLYGIKYPDFAFYCTKIISQSTWRNLSSYSLPLVASFLDISFAHHDPVEDACCSAIIANKACKSKSVSNLEELTPLIEVQPGRFCFDSYCPCCSSLSGRRHYDKPLGQRLHKLAFDTPINPNADPSHPLYGRKVVFTGTLISMTREEAFQKLLEVGGDPDTGVTQRTNYLVMGVQDFCRFSDGKKSSKTQKAEELAAKGFDIEIIGESEFLEML